MIAKLWHLACPLAENVEPYAENSPTIANRLLHRTSRAAIAETTLTLGFLVGYKLATFLPIYQLLSASYAAGSLSVPTQYLPLDAFNSFSSENVGLVRQYATIQWLLKRSFRPINYDFDFTSN